MYLKSVMTWAMLFLSNIPNTGLFLNKPGVPNRLRLSIQSHRAFKKLSFIFNYFIVLTPSNSLKAFLKIISNSCTIGATACQLIAWSRMTQLLWMYILMELDLCQDKKQIILELTNKKIGYINRIT